MSLYRYFAYERIGKHEYDTRIDDIIVSARSSRIPSRFWIDDRSIHDYATVYIHILSGLSEGILSSRPLFKTLCDIEECSFPDTDPDHLLNKDTRARSRAIILAMIAYTTVAQFELLCAVLGLFSKRAHDSNDIRVHHRIVMHLTDHCEHCEMLLGFAEAAIVLGKLILPEDRRKSTTPGPEIRLRASQATRKRIQAEAVAMMMLREWKNIVMQMKVLRIFHPFSVYRRHGSIGI